MGLVRAKEPCYLHEVGYKAPEDGDFEYSGPKHASLASADVKNPKKPDADKQ